MSLYHDVVWEEAETSGSLYIRPREWLLEPGLGTFRPVSWFQLRCDS